MNDGTLNLEQATPKNRPEIRPTAIAVRNITTSPYCITHMEAHIPAIHDREPIEKSTDPVVITNTAPTPPKITVIDCSMIVTQFEGLRVLPPVMSAIIIIIVPMFMNGRNAVADILFFVFIS